jgi:sec-independent protein translocase protein TatC
MVKVDTLASNRGYVLIGIFVIAAFLTPPDAISQCIMAVPMYLLYEIGIVMSRVMLKAKLKRQAEEEATEKNADA